MHTSHNVRDDRGFVCCPTLKSIVCSYCGIKGHGPKYCSRLEKDKKEQQRAKTIKADKPFKEPVKDTPVKKSIFAALEMSSESESDEDAIVEVNVEPPVKKPVTQVTSKPAPWATAQPRVTKWTDLYDSADEDECDD
jgi:hypothetical protein